MSIIEHYSSYKTPFATNYTPNFRSPVARIAVYREMALKLYPTLNKEIVVDYLDGRVTFHKFSEFESILCQVYEDAKEEA